MGIYLQHSRLGNHAIHSPSCVCSNYYGLAGRLPHTHPQNTSPPHVAGRSLTLRVGFYLPERFRELGTTRRQDSRTPNASPPHTLRVSSRSFPSKSASPPPTLRVSPHFAGHLPRTAPQKLLHPPTLRVSSRAHPLKPLTTPHFAGRSLALRVFFRALLPKNSSALPLCGSSSATAPPQNTLAPIHCGSFSHIAGRFLPTRALSRTRDYETAAPQTPRRPLLRCGSSPAHCPSPKHTRSPHVAGHSPTLRVGFYLPECCRDCETTRRRDDETAAPQTPRRPLLRCGSPLTLRVVSLLRSESTTKISAVRCGCATLCCA